MNTALRWRTRFERVLLAPTTVDLTSSLALLPDIAARAASLGRLTDDELTAALRVGVSQRRRAIGRAVAGGDARAAQHQQQARDACAMIARA